jgi:hypothetical protein
MSVVASDDFNRADNADVGATWTTVGAALRITSNAAVFSTGNDADSAETHTTTLATDHWAEGVIKSPIAGGVGQGYGVIVRASTGGSFGYYRAVGNSSGWSLDEFGGGGFVGNLASGSSPTFANGDTIYLEAQGSTLVVKKGTTNGAGGTTVTTQSDATLTGTLAGIGYSSSGGGGGVDAFVMGDFTGAATPQYIEQNSRRNHPGRGPYSLGRYFRPRVEAFTLTEVTAALSGQAITSALGTLTPSNSLALSGQAITVAQGTVAAALSKALSGQAITSATGTLTPALSLALSGQAITASQGTVTASTGATAALTGESIALAAGTVLPTLTIALTGQQANFAQGTVNAGNDVTRALSGQQIDSASGTLAPALSKALSGQAATFGQGTVTATQGFVVALTGQSFSATQGALALSVSAVLTGQSLQATAGAIGVMGEIPPSDVRIEYQAINFNQSGFDQRGIEQGYFDAR